jgi:protease IV
VIAVFALRNAVTEAPQDDSFPLSGPAGVSLYDLVSRLKKASDIILDATGRGKARLRFGVSMGDVAGRGGYYVACASDMIFADQATITASSGVVGGKLATGRTTGPLSMHSGGLTSPS